MLCMATAAVSMMTARVITTILRLRNASHPAMRGGDHKRYHDNSQTLKNNTGSVNYRRKTVCACCAWRPQGIATTILRLRKAIHPAMWSGNRKGCHDNSQALPYSLASIDTTRQRE